MKLATKHNNVTSNGNIGQESKFNIAVNAKMFRVLSDTMYMNKIGSIVREISCNAMDAHIEVGTPDLPFTIHLPNAIEPWFAVKDQGTGLSDPDIRVLYSTYGESTKDHSNDVTGAFGLGSKTPFAYTDQFTITSIYGHIKRIYVAVINDSGLPVLNLQSEEKTTEHSGLEVLMAVSNDDFTTFRDEVLNQLKFFRIKPELTNNMSQVEFEDIVNNEHITYQNEDITIFSGKYHQDPIEDLFFVQGGVGYPVDVDELKGISKEVKEFAEAINSQHAFVTVPIGTIGVTANREGISYEPATIKSIIDALQRISTKVCEDAVKEIKTHTNLWDRCVSYNQQIKIMQQAISSSLNIATLFEGATTDTRNSNNMALSLEKLEALGVKAVNIKKREYRRRNTSYGSTDWKLQRVVLSTPDRSKYYEGTFLYPKNDMVVFLRDTNSKPVARLKLYLEEGDFPTVLVLEALHGGMVDTDKVHVAKALGIDPSNIKLMSELAAPKASSNGTPAGKRARGYLFPGTAGRRTAIHTSKDWEPIMDLDEVGEAVYLTMERHSIHMSDNARKLLDMVKADHFDIPIIAVNEMTAKRIQDGKVGEELLTPDQAMKPIEDAVKAMTPVYLRYIRLSRFVSNAQASTIWKVFTKENIKDLINGDIVTKIGKIEALVEGLKNEISPLEYELKTVVDAQHEAQVGSDAGSKVTDQLKKQYPMMKHLGWHLDDDETIEVIEYINLVDNACKSD